MAINSQSYLLKLSFKFLLPGVISGAQTLTCLSSLFVSKRGSSLYLSRLTLVLQVSRQVTAAVMQTFTSRTVSSILIKIRVKITSIFSPDWRAHIIYPSPHLRSLCLTSPEENKTVGSFGICFVVRERSLLAAQETYTLKHKVYSPYWIFRLLFICFYLVISEIYLATQKSYRTNLQ